MDGLTVGFRRDLIDARRDLTNVIRELSDNQNVIGGLPRPGSMNSVLT